MKATIYIPENKSEVYEKAKVELGDSISATFVRCLERELASKRLETERIVVQILDKEERAIKKAFEGRWIVGAGIRAMEDHSFDQENTGIQGGAAYSVAVTKNGRLVVVAAKSKNDDLEEFEVYDDFDEFSTSETGNYPRYPASLIAAVADGLDIDHIEDLDI